MRLFHFLLPLLVFLAPDLDSYGVPGLGESNSRTFSTEVPIPLGFALDTLRDWAFEVEGGYVYEYAFADRVSNQGLTDYVNTSDFVMVGSPVSVIQANRTTGTFYALEDGVVYPGGRSLLARQKLLPGSTLRVDRLRPADPGNYEYTYAATQPGAITSSLLLEDGDGDHFEEWRFQSPGTRDPERSDAGGINGYIYTIPSEENKPRLWRNIAPTPTAGYDYLEVRVLNRYAPGGGARCHPPGRLQ